MKASGKKYLSLLLTLTIVLSLIPICTLSASAAYENTYKNTGNQRIDIVGVAKTQLGYREGTNNDTKYGDWYGLPNQPWCAMFVSWCARQADIPTSILKNSAIAAPDATYFNIPYYNGSSYTPQSGDIFFTKQWSHVGIVYYTDGNYFYTIEGNSNNTGSSEGNGVYSLKRKTSDYYFGVPNYNNSSNLTKLTTFPTPIKAQTKATGKTTVYNYPDGSAITNKIYDTDLCTIKTIYTNGWCKVTFPLDAGGTETGYVKTSVFFNPDYTTFKVTASKQITTYPRSTLSGSFGYAASGDTVYIIGHTSSAVQILYPLTEGGYKAGWVPISAVTYTIKYNSNGGTGSMSSSDVKYQNSFKLTANAFTKTGHTFSGWNAYRNSDKTWYCTDNGWKTASQITSNGYTKKTYINSLSGAMGRAWMNGGETNDTLTFYAVWNANTLTTSYNANGGTIDSDKYKLSSNLIYKTSDNTKYVQTWTYNVKKTNGITNSSTFGLLKTGHTFKGWGTSASGGTIFDQDNVDLLPATINSDLKSKSCSSTLYAIWEPNTLNVYYNANGGTVNSDKYKLSSNLVYKISDNTKYVQTWTYNVKKTNGLNNCSTLDISKTGHTFKGWGTSANGGTIFDQDNVDLLPATINSNLKTGNCSSTMYAIWEPNILTVHYKANGGVMNSEEFTLIDDYICNKNDNSKRAHTWEYNKTEENGLDNASTYGLTRPGYKFLGWATSPSGTIIFDQNNTTIEPTDLTTDIKTKSCTLDLYAIWEKDFIETPTEIPTETTEPTEAINPTEATQPTEITDSTEVTEPTEKPTEIIIKIGDVNLDGSVTIIDATIVQQHLAQIRYLSENGLKAADTDKDGYLSVMDATFIQRFVAQLIEAF